MTEHITFAMVFYFFIWKMFQYYRLNIFLCLGFSCRIPIGFGIICFQIIILFWRIRFFCFFFVFRLSVYFSSDGDLPLEKTIWHPINNSIQSQCWFCLQNRWELSLEIRRLRWLICRSQDWSWYIRFCNLVLNHKPSFRFSHALSLI